MLSFLFSFLTFFHVNLAVSALDFNSLYLCLFLERCHESRCATNEILRKGEHLVSENQEYQFHLRRNGNLVLTCRRRPIWTSFNLIDDVDFLYLNKEGHLILCGKDSSVKWRIFSLGQGEKLFLQNDGQIVLYNLKNKSIWKKGNRRKCRTGLVKCVYFRIYH